MAGTKINTYAVGDVNLTNMMLTLDSTRKGYNAATITHMNDTTVPAIAAGSMIEINGALYSFATEEAITIGGVADGTVYIIIDPSTITASFTATAPTWSDSKQGWYGTSGTANCRYLHYSIYKLSTTYLKSNNIYDNLNVTSNITLATKGDHYINSTTKLNLTLPAISSVGDIIQIIDVGGGGYNILMNSGQRVIGRTWSKSIYSSLKLICITANTLWQIIASTDFFNFKGYCIGGGNTSSILYLNLNMEISGSIVASLAEAILDNVGISSNLKGYSLGGYTGTYKTTIEYLNFSIESRGTIAATLNTAKSAGSGVQGYFKGYILGGWTGSAIAVIEDLNFADETSNAITATLDAAKYDETGISGSLKGYILGGNIGSPTSVIEDLNFTTETSSAISATLDTAKYGGTGIYNLIKGYIMGGYTTTYTAVIEDLNFTTETSSAISATLDTAKNYGFGASGYNKGYILGGIAGGSPTSVIEDLNFTTETSSAISATLGSTKSAGASVQGYN
jgi:hypothetical protein